MGFLTRAGGRQIYFEHYAGRGPAVVLAHGWGMSCRVWDDTIARLLDRGHVVIAYDQRGCGLTSLTPPFTFARLADDVDAMRRALVGERRIILLGGSFGGMIAV